MPRVTITASDNFAQPYRFQLDRGVVTIGRGSENDIVVDSGSVSTRHAEMRRIRGGYELADVGSTNGLKMDGTRYETVPLQQGSSVQVGDVTFDFTLSDDELAVLADEAPATPAPGSLPQAGAPIRPVPQRQVIVVEKESSGGRFWMVLLLLIFALIAFGIGAGIRHQKDTGSSLIEDVKAKFSTEKKTATPPGETPAVAAPAE